MLGARLTSALDRELTPPRAKHCRLALASPPQKVQEGDPLVFTGLVDAQDDQVVLDGSLGEPPVRKPSVPGEALDRVLGVSVVPGNTVVIEEGEQLAAVLL